VMNVPHLTLPHPRLQQRHFVLLPLKDLTTELIHPVVNKTINNLLKSLPPAIGISQLQKVW